MTHEQILALLQAKYPGVRKDGLAQLAHSIGLVADTDEDVNAAIAKLTEDKVNQFVTAWRKDADAENQKAAETREANLKAKFNLVDKGNPTPTPQPQDKPAPQKLGELTLEQLKEVMMQTAKEAVQPIAEQVHGFQLKDITATREQEVSKLLDNLPGGYKNAVLGSFRATEFKDDEAFKQFLETTKTDVASFKQELADKGLAADKAPIMGSQSPEGVSVAVSEYIKNQAAAAKGEDKFAGKKL